jgi:hypothetical protein
MNQIPNQNQTQKNPLAGWFRQPKIYVRLPSKGKFYPQNALDRSANDEYPVYSMTAKDELMFKTPDALLTGQSTVEVIKSCFPAILEPWSMPSLDLDFVLIAIRIATYGDRMDVDCKCPKCSAENTYPISLQPWMDMFSNFEYNDTVHADPLTIKIRPYSYKETTKISLKTMEQQKLFTVINDEELDDEVKLEKFGKGFVKITELTIDVIADCITGIETPDGVSTDKEQIKEFINNCPKDIFDKIQIHLTSMRAGMEFKVKNVACGECSTVFDIPITMDNSNFFAVRSPD